jgi:hypothetical protein
MSLLVVPERNRVYMMGGVRDKQYQVVADDLFEWDVVTQRVY